MDLMIKFLNLVAPSFTFFSLFFFLPSFYLFKSFIFILSSLFTENLAGKVFIITGASSGIGENLAYEYGRRGSRLALTARREKSLQEVADRAHDLGSPDVITIRADVSKVDDCRRLVEETDINFWGSVYTTRFAVPHLRNSKGKIVVMSAASWMNDPRQSVYNVQVNTVREGPDDPFCAGIPSTRSPSLSQSRILSRAQLTATNTIPIGSAEAIVKSGCRGDRYLTHPSWFSAWKVFFPEVLEWGYRLFYFSRPNDSAQEAPSKKILDLTGGKDVHYSPTIQTPEIKKD